MIVGILKEIKPAEHRVSMTPAGVESMVAAGHTVLVQNGAGQGSGWEDAVYAQAGGQLVAAAAQIYARAEMVMHVKEPLPAEYDLIRPEQIVFTYLHLAANEALTRALIKARSVNIGYETIQKTDGSLPLLTPMSEVAGRMSIQQAAKYLEMNHGGRGLLLGGVPGVEPATVLILGGGVVGTEAAKMACGLGAKVYLLDKSLARLRHLSDILPANCFLVMRPGAVLVDVAIDQGGCFETSRPTTHDDPVYVVDGVLHYTVANMPGAVARTSTLALTNATLPDALEIADKGWRRAVGESAEIALGANVVLGKVTHPAVAEALGLAYTPLDQVAQ
jgi:alanine dehydrogenase